MTRATLSEITGGESMANTSRIPATMCSAAPIVLSMMTRSGSTNAPVPPGGEGASTYF